ncbi:MAG: hypothetical protein FWG14_13825 [Peptococcaceae bacterium]|nr:hypothetical protein [Peptococcaceae bacterium]
MHEGGYPDDLAGSISIWFWGSLFMFIYARITENSLAEPCSVPKSFDNNNPVPFYRHQEKSGLMKRSQDTFTKPFSQKFCQKPRKRQNFFN